MAGRKPWDSVYVPFGPGVGVDAGSGVGVGVGTGVDVGVGVGAGVDEFWVMPPSPSPLKKMKYAPPANNSRIIIRINVLLLL